MYGRTLDGRTSSGGGEESVFLSQVLSNIGLPEGGNSGRIETPGLSSGPSSDTETLNHQSALRRLSHPGSTYQRGIVHGVDDDTLVLGAVLTPAADMSLQDIAAVQEGHFAVGLDPDLVAGVRRDGIEGGNVQAELAGLGELANAGTEREQIGAGDAGGEVCDALAHIVDAAVLDAEDMAVVFRAGGRGDQVVQRAAGVVGQLREERLSLGVGERPHDGRVTGSGVVLTAGLMRRRASMNFLSGLGASNSPTRVQKIPGPALQASRSTANIFSPRSPVRNGPPACC